MRLLSSVRRPIRRPRSCGPKLLADATVLDLGIPGEKSVHDFLLRAASGNSPLFRVQAMNRHGNKLLVAIESCQRSHERGSGMYEKARHVFRDPSLTLVDK